VLPGWSNLVQACGGWDNIVLANACGGRYSAYHRQSLGDIGRQVEQDPADVAWDIVLEAFPNRATALFFMMCESDIEMALKFPWMSIGTDANADFGSGEVHAFGLPHPRANGNHPRVISQYVKARSVLTLEDAIRKMTSWPASRMHLHDRGAIREGLWADLTIFDYDRISDVATYDNPTAYPIGIDYVIVNGQIVIDGGKHTGARPGVILRGQGATSQMPSMAALPGNSDEFEEN
jgi:N-acyl-D-amino-acid deacylase